MVRCSLRQSNDHRQGHGTLCCAIKKTKLYYSKSFILHAIVVYITLKMHLIKLFFFNLHVLRSIHKKCPKVPLVVAGGG